LAWLLPPLCPLRRKPAGPSGAFPVARNHVNRCSVRPPAAGSTVARRIGRWLRFGRSDAPNSPLRSDRLPIMAQQRPTLKPAMN
jgi:hypothetical protein